MYNAIKREKRCEKHKKNTSIIIKIQNTYE